MSDRENIARIKAVYDALEEMAAEVVFIAGATVALYADRPSGEARPTDDVDILVELVHYRDYAEIEDRLRKKGFSNDTESKVICRYRVKGIVVDVMPTGANALGFTNSWYDKGYATAMTYSLDERHAIRVFQPAYFLASKMEAFKNTGGGDGRWSPDFEDIVFILNNRTKIWQELKNDDPQVSIYLKKEFGTLLKK